MLCRRRELPGFLQARPRRTAANTTLSRNAIAARLGWVGNTPTTTNVSETYTALDNVNLLKGKHSMNFGGQYQWLENNASTADGPSTPTPLNWSTNETASITGTTYTANTGYSYASLHAGRREQFERHPAAVQSGRRTLPSCSPSISRMTTRLRQS